MRFLSVFSVVATAAVVNAATNSTAVAAITDALKHGDFVGAAIDILTLGDCDIANIAACAADFAPIVVDCGMVAVDQGKNPKEDFQCIEDALKAIGSSGISKCENCIEEGLSIAQSLISTI